MQKVLTRKFFERSALEVARELLGKFLCRRSGGRVSCFMISEVEAYDGFKDKASHAHRGKTQRNFPMFGKAGIWYAYFTYGMHWMLNIVVGQKDYPAAVLIRGLSDQVESSLPISEAFSARSPRSPRSEKAEASEAVAGRTRMRQGINRLGLNGPGKLTKFLKIDKHLNNKLAGRKTGLWMEDRGIKIKKSQIKRAPRVGIDYAGDWAKKPYRFLLR